MNEIKISKKLYNKILEVLGSLPYFKIAELMREMQIDYNNLNKDIKREG